MSSHFIYYNRDHKFIIKEWLGGEKIFGLDRFKDYLSVEDVLETYIGLTGETASVIQAYGSKEQVELYTPNLFEGVWAGTMCLTEPGGGSDVGDMLTKAYPTEDPLVYKIKGTKCFITAGDHDLTENIIHLVLARVDGAAGGTKGLSLFIVPKIWVNDDGSLDEANDVSTIGIEH